MRHLTTPGGGGGGGAGIIARYKPVNNIVSVHSKIYISAISKEMINQ